MNTIQLPRWLSAIALAATLNFTASAQFISYTGGTLSESFNRLATTSTTAPR